jgi:hypothetical protein
MKGHRGTNNKELRERRAGEKIAKSKEKRGL